jgi:hypothetical protein
MPANQRLIHNYCHNRFVCRASLGFRMFSAEPSVVADRAIVKPSTSMHLDGLGTFVPNTGRTSSPDISRNIQMTFLLLSVRVRVPNVCLDRLVEVMVASRTPSQTDPSVPNANGSDVLVDEWDWGAPTGRGPQS